MLEGYKELLAEIELHKNYSEVCETSIDYYNNIIALSAPKGVGGVDYSGLPKGNKNAMDFGEAVTRFYKWTAQKEVELKILEKLENQKRKIDECMNLMDITVKVTRLRAMGLTQEQVAELVDRHVNTIQNIEKKIRKKAIVG